MTDHRKDQQASGPDPQHASGAENTGSAKAGIDGDARRRIGRDLRLLYGSVLDQPIPERFTRLIDDMTADSSNREGSR